MKCFHIDPSACDDDVNRREEKHLEERSSPAQVALSSSGKQHQKRGSLSDP